MVRSPRRALVLLALGSAAASALAGCADEADAELAEEDLAPLVKAAVRTLDDVPEADLVVRDGEVVVSRRPDLATIARGDVLVSARAGGLLRRVTRARVDGDTITLSTEPAALEDAFEQASVRGRLERPAPGDAARTLPVPALELHDQRVVLGNGSEIEIAHGYFSFSPTLDLDMRLKRGRVQKLTVVAAGESHARLDVRYHIKKSELPGPGLFMRADADGVTLAEAPPIFATFWVGWVPVVVTVRARLLASWGLTAGGDVTGEEAIAIDGTAQAGVALRDGAWTNLAARSLAVERTGDASLNSWALNGELHLTARLDVRLYEMAGPFVGLQAYTGVIREASPSGVQWFSHRGLRGIAGAQVAPFGKRFVGYEAVVFDVNHRTPLP